MSSSSSPPPPPSSRTLRERKQNKNLDESAVMMEIGECSNKRKRNTPMRKAAPSSAQAKRRVLDLECKFTGDPIPLDESKKRWPQRYQDTAVKKVVPKKKGEEDEELFGIAHYEHAIIDDIIYSLGDAVVTKGDSEDDPEPIGRIEEFFKTTDDEPFFTAQWFYKAKDTDIKQKHADFVDSRRVFLSNYKNDNPLDCILSKIKVVRVPSNVGLATKKELTRSCDYYYDMQYSKSFSTISNVPAEITGESSSSSSTISSDSISGDSKSSPKNIAEVLFPKKRSDKSEMSLLDLYAGCGGMSTGLCIGAKKSGVKLVTRWAVDINKDACLSLKHNHPETQVRNEAAEDFLALLKEWRKLVQKFKLLSSKPKHSKNPLSINKDVVEAKDISKESSGEDEVERLLEIAYCDPYKKGKSSVHFKVRWKGYEEDEDTWEPLSNLTNCGDIVRDFVSNGYENKILPLPGDVDVICGGPPCQGISGFNRFRNKENPLADEKNSQLIVFMDIVDYLKPRYVLMENVVDIVRFSKGFLIRYAIARLVSQNYQTRLGLVVAGCYGLPQFRMRVFLWGTCPTEKLPSFPLPTHDVVQRGGIPTEFEANAVAYSEEDKPTLETELLLADAISDLPPVTNDESRDEIPYEEAPKTKFQEYIRSSKSELLGTRTTSTEPALNSMLYDHRPLKLNIDDYQRVCLVPKAKGANFRDLPGVIIGPDNKIMWDDSVPRQFLPSGKPLIPDYAVKFKAGSSVKPFGRLWWDETVSTVVTRAEPHNQIIMHPTQDRVLSVRENARLQGFPDFYKLFGTIKERYIQVGNAVAVPVSRALGYALGAAYQGFGSDEPVFVLPPDI